MFPAAEKDLMKRISNPEDGRLDRNLIDAAIMMNPSDAIPSLLEFVKTGKNVAHACRKLSTKKWYFELCCSQG